MSASLGQFLPACQLCSNSPDKCMHHHGNDDLLLATQGRTQKQEETCCICP